MQPCDVTARQSRPVGFYKGGVGVTAVKNVMTTPLMVHTVCDSVHSSRFRLKRMCFMFLPRIQFCGFGYLSLSYVPPNY